MKNNKGIIFAIIALIVVLIGAGTVIFVMNLEKNDTGDSYRSIAVAKTEGDILVLRDSADELNAYEGMKLKDGDAVSVLKDGRMALKADDDKYLLAEENTNFTLEADDSGKKIIINLEDGSVLIRIENALQDDEVYEVHTPNSVMAVRGTVFSIGMSRDENGELKTKLLVFDGTVESACVIDGEAAEPVAVAAGLKLVVKGEDDAVEFEKDPVTGEVIEEITKEDISEVIADELLEFILDGEDIKFDKEELEEIADGDIAVEDVTTEATDIVPEPTTTQEQENAGVPATEAPTTEAPTTEAPTTEAPTTEAPTTEAPTTEAPTTEAPTTEAPTTEAPTTEVPTTEVPTTEAPTTEAPTTEVPTTEVPTTEAPTTGTASTEVVEQERPTATEGGKPDKDRPGHDKDKHNGSEHKPVIEEPTAPAKEKESDEDTMRAAIEAMVIGKYEGKSREGIPLTAEVSKDRDGTLSLTVNVAGIVRTVNSLGVEMSMDSYGISCTKELMPGIYEKLSISFEEDILENGISSAQVEYSVTGFVPMSYSATVTKK